MIITIIVLNITSITDISRNFHTDIGIPNNTILSMYDTSSHINVTPITMSITVILLSFEKLLSNLPPMNPASPSIIPFIPHNAANEEV